MTTAAPASIAARRKNNRNRQFAGTLVHYLGVEEALEVCRKKSWNEVRDEILQQNLASTAPEGVDTHSP